MDLAKRETPNRSQPQTTFRRETTMPRQATDLPGLEVNAQIHRADMSGAEELSRILGLVNNVGQNIAGDVKANQENADTAAATLDFATGTRNDQRYAKSHAYRDAWQLQGAKKLAVDVSTEVTEKFNTALNDPDHPATLEDLDGLFEDTVKAHLVDEHGQPLNFITPQAKATLGTALLKLKEELMPQAAKAIKAQQDDKLFNTTFHNMLFERQAGAPIGAPTVDPLAPLPGPAGLVTAGNIDLHKRPVVKNKDGSISTVRSISIGTDKGEVLIPTVVNDKVVSDKEAIAHYKKTGEHLGIFKDAASANAYAQSLHEEQAKEYAAPIDRFSLKARIAAAESGGSGDGAVNPTSTASGRYGITNGTFTANGGNLARKNDPAEQERVMDSLLAKNEAALTQAGVSLTAGNIYLAHFLGAAGAIKALAKPDAPVAAVVQKANPFTKGWTNSQVIAWAAKKMGERAGDTISDGSGPELATGTAAAPTLRPGFDVEGFMHSLPPSVDKGEAKSWLINSLVAEATSKTDPSLLNGLEDSKRKDGTPSFTPEERTKIAEIRDRLQEHARVEADRAERELQENNSKTVLQAIVDGKPPSKAWLSEQSRKGLLDENFVYSLTNHMDEQAKQEAREALADAREAQREEDNDLDTMTYAMVAERRAGIMNGSSYQEDLKRWKNGELGNPASKKSAARFLQLQAAAKEGQKMTEQNPDFAFYSGQLADNFKPVRDTGRLMLLKPQAKVDRATYQAMVSLYEEKVHSGEKPGDAYREAVQKYAGNRPKDAQSQLSDIRAQIAALRAKKLGH